MFQLPFQYERSDTTQFINERTIDYLKDFDIELNKQRERHQRYVSSFKNPNAIAKSHSFMKQPDFVSTLSDFEQSSTYHYLSSEQQYFIKVKKFLMANRNKYADCYLKIITNIIENCDNRFYIQRIEENKINIESSISSINDKVVNIEEFTHDKICLDNIKEDYEDLVQSCNESFIEITFILKHKIINEASNERTKLYDYFNIKKREIRRLTMSKYNEAENDCIVCYNKITEKIIIIPCGHTIVCAICLNTIMETTNICPICREYIDAIQQVC